MAQRIGCGGGFAIGFFAGFAALFILILIFGDYDYDTDAVAAEPAQQQPVQVQQAAPTATAQPQPPATPAGIALSDICNVDESSMTDPQIENHANQFEGREFSGWQVWVYDVASYSDGYDLQLSSEDRDDVLFWGRDIVIENIPDELAQRLNVNQALTLSGRIDRIDTTFEVVCNPMYVTDYQLQE